jgi:hypothetical protein
VRGKSKTGLPLYNEVVGCATGSARLFGAHVMRAGFVAIYFWLRNYYNILLGCVPRSYGPILRGSYKYVLEEVFTRRWVEGSREPLRERAGLCRISYMDFREFNF